MVNKVFLIGRLGKDPVIKHFSNDNAIAEFPIATTESYKDKEGNWKEITDWHNIKCNNRYTAERAEKQLKKGSMIYVEGKIRTRNYDDKDGNKRYVTEIIVESFRILDKRNEGGGGQYEGGGSVSTSSMASDDSSTNEALNNDLPF